LLSSEQRFQDTKVKFTNGASSKCDHTFYDTYGLIVKEDNIARSIKPLDKYRKHTLSSYLSNKSQALIMSNVVKNYLLKVLMTSRSIVSIRGVDPRLSPFLKRLVKNLLTRERISDSWSLQRGYKKIMCNRLTEISKSQTIDLLKKSICGAQMLFFIWRKI